MRHTRTRISTALPVDPQRLLDHARLDESQLYEIAAIADSVGRDLENYADLALMNQSIRVQFEEWPGTEWLALPIAPYVAGAPMSVTVAGQAVTAFTAVDGLRPSLRLADLPVDGEIVITYQAGFGATLAAIPPDLQHAIIDQAVCAFDLRGQSGPKFGTGLSPHMARVAARYRRVAL